MPEPVLTSDPRGELQVELHRLQLRFADTRVREPHAIEQLTRSIESCGQLVPCIAVRELEAVEAVSEDAALQAIPGWVVRHDEGIAARASDIDVVYNTGYGVPRVLGVPMRYAGNHFSLDVFIFSIHQSLEMQRRSLAPQTR